MKKCGVDDYGFYDRRGDYFRKGVDPCNYFGRHVEDHIREIEHNSRMADMQRQALIIAAPKLGVTL